MRFEGKVVVVTGASRGIGRAIALAFAGEGADVACIATTEANAGPIAAEIEAMGRRSAAVGCLVENAAAVTRAFTQIGQTLGSADILVNNAGISRPKPVLEMTEDDWDAHLDINAKSIFLCSQAAARQMLAVR